MRNTLFVTMLATAVLTFAAQAQTTPPPESTMPPPAATTAPPPAAAPMAAPSGAATDPATAQPGGRKQRQGASGKRAACQQATRAKGLRGPDARSEIAVCMQEARLDCTKQAAAQKLQQAARKDFMKTCMSE